MRMRRGFGREERKPRMRRIERMRQEEMRKADAAPRTKRTNSRRLPSRYDILIQCRDEEEQRQIFERLRSEGLSLRLLVL
jgi:hypothetical protein